MILGLEQLAAVLAAANLGTPGQSLFIHRMPAEIQQGILLLTPLAGMEIDHELPGWRRGGFQMIVRATSANNAIQLALSAGTALTWAQPKTLAAISLYPAMRVLFCRPLHDPIMYPRSDGNLIEASVNFEMAYIKA